MSDKDPTSGKRHNPRDLFAPGSPNPNAQYFKPLKSPGFMGDDGPNPGPMVKAGQQFHQDFRRRMGKPGNPTSPSKPKNSPSRPHPPSSVDNSPMLSEDGDNRRGGHEQSDGNDQGGEHLSDYERHKQEVFKVRQAVRKSCASYRANTVDPIQQSQDLTAYTVEYGRNIIPDITTNICNIYCNASGGECVIALGRAVDNCQVNIFDCTPEDKTFCIINVMLHAGATVSASDDTMLNIQGRSNKSQLSTSVFYPGAVCSLCTTGSSCLYLKTSDGYQLLSVLNNNFEDIRTELKMKEHGFSYHSYYNPTSIVA